MKISQAESSKALAGSKLLQGKILPETRPRFRGAGRGRTEKQLSPLEHGMVVAESALRAVPDVRESLVRDLRERIERGEYKVSAEEIAEMMLRRLAADRMR
jgi:flagellar biosynthesis anti-sigma factor FlgM